ncbi:hypothetical protein ACIPY1_19065 [Paenarthrobacter nicotinovorans]|uniref:hypothetical protein n=1 Tax=Paenarthrobacter nicotinovorans TaxID=29320 RepID=UPI0038088265
MSAAPGLQIVAVELKTSAEELDWTRELLEAVQESSKCQIYVELTAQQIARGALELIAGTAVRLKVRTGGADESFFPTSAQLASVLSAAARERVPFKLTAGLHRAIRYTDRSTGITHHGFLNIAVATGLAELGASTAELQAVLSQTSAETVVQEFNAMESEWRQSFNSFGTCSISEPIETLEMVGVLLPGAMSLVLSTKKAATS